MSNFQIRKATKTQAKGRIGLVGPAGSGKTYTALRFARVLAQDGGTCLIDSEACSSEKYADKFEFDILPLEPPYSPATYKAAIEYAEKAGYAVIIIDSLSHAWAGQGGALEMVDASKSKYQGNSYVAWRDVTPMHNALVEAILQSDAHIIACMRSKTEYAQEKDEKTGKTTVRKIGLQPIQREGMDYEFDIVLDIDWDHRARVTKTRMDEVADLVVVRPGEDLAETILAWLTSGEKPAEKTNSENPTVAKTQKELLKYAKQAKNLDGKGVGSALQAAGINEFNPDLWEAMVQAIDAYQPMSVPA